MSEEPKCKNHPDRPAVLRKDSISRGLCEECLRSCTRKARASRGTGSSPDAKEKIRISLDFTEYPDLLTRLQEMAQEEFRPLEMEILYLLQIQSQADSPPATS